MHLSESVVVEHRDDDLWDSVCIACKKAIKKFDEDPKYIIGLGVDLIRCCRVLLKVDGNLAAPIISWMDKRVSTSYEHVNEEVAYVTSVLEYLSNRFTVNFNDNIGNNFDQWSVDYETWQWSK